MILFTCDHLTLRILPKFYFNVEVDIINLKSKGYKQLFR